MDFISAMLKADKFSRRILAILGMVMGVLTGLLFVWSRPPSWLVMGMLFLWAVYSMVLWSVLGAQEEYEVALKKAKETADQATLTRGEFLSTMSHEIRTPMNAIIGMTELLRETALDAQQGDLIKVIDDSAQALLRIINDILDFSKIDVGKLNIANEPFDLESVLDGGMDILAVRAHEKRLRLLSHFDTNIPSVLIGDAGRIRQVLLNLIGNAIKFTPIGQVAIAVVCTNITNSTCHLLFEVTDTGIGINDDVVSRLFSPFTQADGSVTRRFGGTGLGLSICKRLVELMGGEIGVNSTSNQGSTFWFTLHLSIENAAPKKFGSEASEVLLIENNSCAATMITDYLRSAKVAVHHAKTGTEAIEALRRRRKIDALILSSEIKDVTPSTVYKIAAELIPSARSIWLDHGTTRTSNVLEEINQVLSLPLKRTALFDAINVSKNRMPAENNAEIISTGSAENVIAAQAETVLLVEDNIMNQKVAVHQLRNLGYSVAIANNGEEALSVYQKNNAGLILMDCQMPIMDGYEATRRIRHMEANSGRHIPIIAMTANAMMGDKEKCLASGMDDYLTKPILKDRLRHVLTMFLPLDSPEILSHIDEERLSELFGSDLELRNDMLDMFLVHTGPVTKQLEESANQASPDFDLLAATGHRLAGSCLNLGIVFLGKLGRNLEHAARRNDAEQVRTIARAIIAEFDGVTHFIRGSDQKHS